MRWVVAFGLILAGCGAAPAKTAAPAPATDPANLDLRCAARMRGGKIPEPCFRLAELEGDLAQASTSVDELRARSERGMKLLVRGCYGDEANACLHGGTLALKAYLKVASDPKVRTLGEAMLEHGCDLADGLSCTALGYALIDEARQPTLPADRDRGLSFLERGCKLRIGTACMSAAQIEEEKGRFAEAFALHSAGCGLRELDGCIEQGRGYLEGRGTDRDERLAAKSFRAACNGGKRLGCGALGKMYVLGEGVVLDRARGMALLEKSCREGEAWSCEELKAGVSR